MQDNNNIKIDITLDENNYPKAMHWSNTEAGKEGKQTECKAMLLSLFEKDYKDTYRIDLWTKEMQVPEMDMFMYYTLKGLADSYYTATKNAEIASAIRQLADYLAEQTKVVEDQEGSQK